MPPSQNQNQNQIAIPTGTNVPLPYSQYDIVKPVPIPTSAEDAAAKAEELRTLKTTLQALIHGPVLHREDMPPSSLPTATSSQTPAPPAAPSGPTPLLEETFLSTTRIFNSAAPVAAHLVALPTSTADVVAILQFCTRHGLSPSVKSGGYATAGWAVQGDVVVDLSRMNGVKVVRPEKFWGEEKMRRRRRGAVRPGVGAGGSGDVRPNEGVGCDVSGSGTRSGMGMRTASRTRKADEAFAPGNEEAVLNSPSTEFQSTTEQKGRKRTSPSSLTGGGTTSPSGSGSGSGSGSRSTTTSTEGTSSSSSGVTDASSENNSADSVDAQLPSPQSEHSCETGSGSGSRTTTTTTSTDPSSGGSGAGPSSPKRQKDVGRKAQAQAQAQAGVRTGLADHLSWQRHHRPDGRASTHERVVVPDSGPFVWRAADVDGAGSGSSLGASASATSFLPTGTGTGGHMTDFMNPDQAHSGHHHAVLPPHPTNPNPNISSLYPFATPPSVFHAARIPSALLPTHSHEQPWQEARFRQQIAESALHHRQRTASGPGAGAGAGGSSSHTGMVGAVPAAPTAAGGGPGVSGSFGGRMMGGTGTGGTFFRSGAPPTLPGWPPLPANLPAFAQHPYSLSPDGMPQNNSADQQQHQQVTTPSTPEVPRPGIYTRPYLLAVFGPGVGVRALDLATDEAGRMNSWDSNPWDEPVPDGEMILDDFAGGQDEEADDEEGEAHEVDWEEPMRSTPYHCPLSAYPVGSTAMTTGGFGYLSRAYGLSLDNVVEVEMVLADGRVVVLNEGSKKRSQEEADLWWAVRGAAPCFGVVTKIVAKAYPIPSCFSGNLIFPFNPATAPSLIKHWRDCLKGNMPREMYTNLILVAGPNPSAHVIMIQICLLQNASKGETFVQAIASWTGERMLLKDVEERPFLAQQDGVAQVLKGGGGRRWMIRGDTLENLTDELIGQSVHRFQGATANRGVWLFELVNGAIADNAAEEEGDVEMEMEVDRAGPSSSSSADTRFSIPATRVDSPSATGRVTKETCLAPSLRKAHFMVGALQQWEDFGEDLPCVISVDGWLRDAVSPISVGGPFPSFLERSETRERIASTFGEANFERLVRVKRAVDPLGLFRHTFGAGLTAFAGVGGGEAGVGGVGCGSMPVGGKDTRIL